ncbi:STF2-like protein [Cladophialophora carrionii]|uniref:STF2-like protein n=1 Tax=Cladophialophora carrionii TaxID=86049 RepID=A0A1C1CS71_9EURO|nr:STF2-like protein [Cladophialophora carrionii]
MRATGLSLQVLPNHVTRTNKGNDRNHSAIADGTALPEERLPRYFAKHGHVDADPKGVKKQGGGRGNWGRDGEEAQDYGYTLNNARRRSNSSTQALGDFKTKFETMDTDPVFEEELHGPTEEDIEKASTHDSTDSSTLGGSIDDDDKKL